MPILMNRKVTIVVALLLAVCLLPQASGAEPRIEFLRDVKPILAQRCFRCHSSLEQESNLRLDSVAAILKGGDGGAVVLPGKSSESRLIAAVERRGELKMPPEGEPLTEQQIGVLRAWIEAGAAEGTEVKPEHWAFQRPLRPAAPEVADPAWATNPIDRFIAAKHADLRLTPVGEAPANVLMRRVYLDLIGLPPTPEELESFRSEGYQEAVDRLLASPHYGERWGRHWMDVWRYSDWDGYKAEVRESKPHIWRWRDWIVESLNADKPYDQMVQQMLAADELSPDNPEALRATGYLVRSWYKFNRNKWLDDAIEHTGKAFLGLTFNCCRCHDHMYDPLAQRDYYALRAFFEPYDVRTDRLPGEANTDKVGLVRVFDAKIDAPTFLFRRGNDKDPVQEEPLAPAVPQVFSAPGCAIEPVKLPRDAGYPGLAGFVREETLAAARKELAQAKAALTKAELKFAQALRTPQEPPPSPEPQAPGPSSALSDADAQLALSAASVKAAETNLAFAEVRLVADDANYSSPPAAIAQDLALLAGAIERRLAVQQAEKALIQADISLTAARRAKKEGDAKTATAVTNAETALANALKTRGDAFAALDKPVVDYTHFTPTYPTTSTGRRLALARWITSPENPLAARVAINHIWLRHFGAPLVPTMFDFGMNGKPPTNQPLLDWLAVELIDSGWRMKHIHKLIVTSRTYRLASSQGFRVQGSDLVSLNPEPRTQNPSIDPENLYYWRANPRRMEAEIVRDATLWVAGSLDAARGGPDLDPEQGLTVPRRSLYFRATKEKKIEFLSLFDSANPVECYRRSDSIAPQQALAMANSTLTLAQARILAKKISESLVGMPADDVQRRFVSAAYLRILCRASTNDETETCLAFLEDQARKLAETSTLTAFASGPAAIVAPSADPQQRARENLVHVLLNHNDFVTVR
jgi:Protein of unknown function (DUF1549)/Protein of unknown function (DUF1553)/Planctomycete cytochrome C